MKRLEFRQTASLNQDSEGTIRVTGSRITFDTVIAAFKRGDTAEEIKNAFPSLSLEQINEAIQWYGENQAEAEDYLTKRLAEAEELRQEIENHPEQVVFRDRMRQRRDQLIKN